jgi:competence protein ComEC
MQVPALRSYLMILFVLVAVFFGRNPISLRGAFLAAFLILLFYPELLLTAGFQLSFIAVLVLVTYFEKIMRYFKRRHLDQKNFFHTLYLAVLGVGMVSLLATLSTLPFVVFHFNQIALYSVLGNLMTSFLFSFIIMPLLLVAVLLMPFGMDVLFFKITAFFLDIITHMCVIIDRLPFATIRVPSFSAGALFLFLLGFFCLFLIRRRIKYFLALAFFATASLSYLLPRPDILLATDPKLMAFRNNSGDLEVTASLGQNYWTAKIWLTRDGQDPYLLDVKPDIVLTDPYLYNGYRLSFSNKTCPHADITVLSDSAERRCPGIIITYDALQKNGTYAFYLDDGEIKIKTVADDIGHRPWR